MHTLHIRSVAALLEVGDAKEEGTGRRKRGVQVRGVDCIRKQYQEFV